MLGSMRQWRRALGSLLLLALLALVFFADTRDDLSGPPEEQGARSEQRSTRAFVTRVIDGDTVEVRIGDHTDDVRYIGIDTPETVKPGEPVQCLGPRASSFNHRLVEQRTVRLVFDAERRDVYGRLLAYVYLRGELVNAELVRRGLARTLTIEPNDTHAGLFARLQRVAGRAGRGLWGACPP
jgi:micrococcal nuclease